VPDKIKFFERKADNSDVADYKSNAPNHVAPFLRVMDERFVNMCKAIVTDDITIAEEAHKKKWDPSSTKARKFWLQSPIYRQVLNYAVISTMTGTSRSISYMVTKLGSTYTTIQKVVNEAEAEGYIDVFNKGDSKSKTTIAAKRWMVLDYMQKYCISRAEGWNAVLNDFDTNNFHIWYEAMKADPKKSDKFAESFRKALEAEEELQETFSESKIQ
jgi:hypothetical protein|tara:strand:+ start:143 stop:787 length:645 start_codon:yes stop_codon:yes gene_type:complete